MTSRYSQLQDKNWLENQLREKPLRQIAEEIGCSYSAVVYMKNKFGIFVGIRRTRRSSLTKSASIKIALKKKYPNGRYGKLASNWRGGKRFANNKGYVYIYKPDHPYATKEGYVMEHRLVMEKRLGRYLLPTEMVHHKNRNKSDNRDENLQLVNNHKEHSHVYFENAVENDKLKKEVDRLQKILQENNIPY